MKEGNQRHAYLVMAHNNVGQLNELLTLLDDKGNDVFLHIDAKSSIREDELIQFQKGSLISIERMHVYWADYSQVECELRLLKEAVREYHAYYHLLSGNDLPLKSQAEIHKFFSNRDNIFLHYTTPEKTKETLSYVKYYNIFQKKLSKVNRDKEFSIYKVFNKMFLIAQRCLKTNRVPNGMTIKKGANWFSIPHDFAEYVIQHENEINIQFSMTRSPDEFFMQTLAFNSAYKKRIYRFLEDDGYASCLRLIDWKRGNPYVFRFSDYKELIESDMLFARKFDSALDCKIISELTAYVMNGGNENV